MLLKPVISCQDHRIIEIAYLLRIYKLRVYLWISYFFDDIITIFWLKNPVIC